MLITPGPLLLQANDKIKGIWLKSPARWSGSAIATVWHTKEPDQGPGNAVVMAYAGELYTLASALSSAKTTEDALTAKKIAKDLLQRIERAAP